MGTWEESSNPSYFGEPVVLAAMAVGSLLIVLGVAAMVIRNRRRRRVCLPATVGGHSTCLTEMCVETPTDFMNNLASWDSCHPIDEILEKRRRAVWTLEMFEHHNVKDQTHSRKENTDGNSRIKYWESQKNPLICL